MKRRDFIIGGATAAAGLTCLSTGLRAAVLEAKQAGKPLLTESNLNGFIRTNSLRTKKGQDVSAEAVQDLDGFVQNRFHLTETQLRELAAIPAEDKRKLTEAIQDMREKKGHITFHIVPAKRRADHVVAEANHPSPSAFLGINIKAGHNDDLGWYIIVTVSK